MKNSSNTIGNRTHDIPACSALPEPTAPPRIADMLATKKYKGNISLPLHFYSKVTQYLTVHALPILSIVAIIMIYVI